MALTGLTVAEYFRDEEGADTLLFIDNIFRFTQAGSEVSALLGRMPSAVGYQPNLATEMGELQERITSTKKGLGHFSAGDLRSCRRLDRSGSGHHIRSPGRHHRAFSCADGNRDLPRSRSAGFDIPHSRSAHCRPGTLRRAQRVKRTLQTYKDLQDIIAILGIDEFSEDEKLTVARARKMQRSSRSRSTLPSSSPVPGPLREGRRHCKGFREIVEGKYDDIPEQAFYMKGTIDEVLEAAEKMKAAA